MENLKLRRSARKDSERIENLVKEYNFKLVPPADGFCDEEEMICKKILDNDGNLILTEGLVLQDAAVWKGFFKKDILPRNNASELYFEEKDIEGFVRKLEDLYPDTVFVNRLMTHSWGQKVIRFYDPDGNLIEVGTPMGEPL